MDRLREFTEDSVIFLIMAIFSVMRNLIASDEPINWTKSIAKVFSNLVAGVGFYSFLLSYRPWYGEYPQKIGIIMVVTYTGSKLVDLLVDKLFIWLKGIDFKSIIRKLFDL